MGGGSMAHMRMDYSVLSDLHNMHVWVWAGAFTQQTHRAPGLGVGSPRRPMFSMAYNNGPHSGSTTHLAWSDKWFSKRTHTALCPACRPCAQTHCRPLKYSICSCEDSFSRISLTLATMHTNPAFLGWTACSFIGDSWTWFLKF